VKIFFLKDLARVRRNGLISSPFSDCFHDRPTDSERVMGSRKYSLGEKHGIIGSKPL
jgi:hypothetical protein